jgi:CDP-L-myo-inositol myo-inositolphosphotransferase
MRATLIFTDPVQDLASFLGLPIALRTALRLGELGVAQIVLRGPGSERALELFRGEPRLKTAVVLGTPGGASDAPPLAALNAEPQLVLLADAFVTSSALAHLAVGSALADPSGRPLAASLLLAHDQDPLPLMASAIVVPLPPGQLALRMTDPASRAQIDRQLFADLIKPSDGPVSRHFNRHVSRAVTRLVLPLGMTPNAMTVVVAITGILAAVSASFATYGMHVLGAALFQLHSILDGCDGELARLTHTHGKHGALIDSLVDDLCNLFFFIGLSIGVASSLNASWPIAGAAVTALAYAGVVTVQYGMVLRATGRGDKTKFWAPIPQAEKLTPFAILRMLLRRDAFVGLILVAVVLGLAPAAVTVFPFAALGALGASLARLREAGRTA